MNEAMEIFKIAKDIMAGKAEREVEKLLKALLPGTPFANKVFSVGGYVRDELIGIPSKDLDAVVDMRDGARKVTKFIYRKFPGQVTRPYQMGKYPIWAITFKEDVEFKGKVYETKGADIELADTQKESFPDENSRQRVTEPGTLKEDVERRDFTVNMLLKDLSTGEMRDLAGTSVNDIKKGILRGHPGVDFNEILRQDPLRMMRLVRFQAKYGWNVPLSVIRTVRKNAGRIKIVSGERIQAELVKLMKIGKLAQGIRFMKTLGLLKYVLPEIEEMQGVEQEYGRGVHQEGDVYKHTMLVLRSAQPGVVNQLAALLHDVGKPKSREVLDGLVRFIGHEKVGGEIAEAIMRRLKFEKKDIRAVRKMVEMHMRPHHLTRDDKASPKALRKFIRDVGEELVDAVLDLAEADEIGNLPTKKMIPKLRGMIENVQNVPVSEKPPLNGNEIKYILGIESGPEVGRAVQFLRDKMDEWADLGKVLGKEDAIKLIKDYK